MSSLDGRPSISVVTGPMDETTAAVVELADHWNALLVVEAWGGDGPSPTVEERATGLTEALDARATAVFDLPIDFSATQLLVDVAGPVTAWTQT